MQEQLYHKKMFCSRLLEAEEALLEKDKIQPYRKRFQRDGRNSAVLNDLETIPEQEQYNELVST